MSIELDDWQKEVLEYDGDLLLCTGRRVGKTYILARKAIDLMAKHPHTNIVIVSITEDQAQIILQMALQYAEENYKKLIGKGRFKPTLKTLTLNGGKMYVRPVGQTGDAIRGFEGKVLVIDEASRMPEKFWMAAKPIILTCKGQIWMASTPFGCRGYFWEKYKEAKIDKKPNARFKVFEVSTEEVLKNRKISRSWTEEQRKEALAILEKDRKEMTAREFLQEYGGQFIFDLNRFFSDQLIQKCMVIQPKPNFCIPPLQPPSFQKAAWLDDYFCGVDIARLGEDESVIVVLKKEEDKLKMEDMLITKKTYLTDTIDNIKLMDKIYDFKKIYIDTGGIGSGVFDVLLKDEQTKNKVVSIDNAKKVIAKNEDKKAKLMKEHLYANLLRLMEKGQIELWNDEKIALSLSSIQYEYEDNKLRIFGRYSHIAEALIRAAWCFIDTKNLNPWILAY